MDKHAISAAFSAATVFAAAFSAGAVGMERYSYPAAAVVAPVEFMQDLPGPAHDAADPVHADKIRVAVRDRAFVESAKPGDVRLYWKLRTGAGWIGGVSRGADAALEHPVYSFDISLAMSPGRARLGDVVDCWVEFRGARYGVSPPFKLVCGGPDELAECERCWTLAADGFDAGAAAANAAARSGAERPGAGGTAAKKAPSFLDASFASLASVPDGQEYAPLAELARKLVSELEGKKRETAAKKDTLDKQLKVALGRAKDAAAAKGDLESVLEFEAAIASPDDPKWEGKGAGSVISSLFAKRRETLEAQSQAAVKDALRILSGCWRKLEEMKVAETRKGNVVLAKEVLRYQGEVKSAGEALQGGVSAPAAGSGGATKPQPSGQTKNWRVSMDCKLSGTVASDQGHRKTSAKSFDVSLKNFADEAFEGELVWHFIGKGRAERDSKVLESRREKVKIGPGSSFEKTVTSGTYSGYSYQYSTYSYSDSSAILVQGAVIQLVKDGAVVRSYASMQQWAAAAAKFPFAL